MPNKNELDYRHKPINFAAETVRFYIYPGLYTYMFEIA